MTSPRALRDGYGWCWDIVVPKPPATGEIYPVLLMDGTRVGGQVCLIVRSPEYVVSWSFASWEASWSWDKLLLTIPPPTVIVCDGQKGMLLSIARCWPMTRIQRCLFHVWQNLRTKLTLHPESEAGIDLLEHYRCIWEVHTKAQANAWAATFYEIHEHHSEFLSERSYSQVKLQGRRSWWYTHRNVRGAYRQIGKLLRDEQLFTHLGVDLLATLAQTTNVLQKIPRTTNHMEGGTNSNLKGQLYIHRGMPSAHQQKLTEWYLYSKTEGRKPPRKCL